MYALKNKSELHLEAQAQLREFVLEQCENGNQSTEGIISILKYNHISYHVGIISNEIRKYQDSL